MHNKQLNFVRTVAVLAATLLWTGDVLAAGSITGPSKPDPLLDGRPTDPCAASPDYAAGTDVHGRTVVPPDVGAPAVPVPDAIAIPLRQNPRSHRRPQTRDSAYVSLDGRKLEPLLNPPPCRSNQR